MLDGAAALFAGDADHAGQGLAHQVKAGLVSIGASLTESAHMAVDHLGIDLLDHVIAQTQAADDAGAVAFHKHVTVGSQLFDHFHRPGILQVHNQRLLASVDPAVGHAFAVDEGSVGAGGVAGLGFNMNDSCAVIGKDGGCAGAGNIGRKIKDFDVVKHLHGVFLRFQE